MRRSAAVLAALLLMPALARAGEAPALSARAAAVVDAVSGRVIYGFNAHEKLPPASLAKMLVALLAAETLDPDDTLIISHRAATTRPDNIRWPEGVSFTIDQVLHAMMMESSNGAAVAIGERIAGSVERFTPLLDARAASLGATSTHIVDPSGLDAPGQYSTARDLALIARAVVREPWLARIAATRKRSIPWPGGSYRLRTFNGFLVRYRGALGIKPGFTSKAGNCLAAAARRNGRTVVAVLLNDRRWYRDAAALMNFGYPRSVRGDVPLAEHPPPGAVSAPLATTARQPAAGRRVPLAASVATGLSLAFVARRRVVRARMRRGP